MAATFAMEALRIVDSRGVVVVSLGPTDRNTKAKFYRVPIRPASRRQAGLPPASRFTGHRIAASPPKHPVAKSDRAALVEQPILFLEALPASPPRVTSSPADQARVLTVVLVALGVLFGLFRCLRGQLRGVRRIGEQLTATRDRQAAGTSSLQGFTGRIEDDLDSLRIADMADSVTIAWNDLIDLTQRLAQTVERSEADRELSAALQKAGGGALSEALDCIPDGIIYITDTTRFEYVNASARRLLEWDAAKPGSRIDMAVTDARATGKANSESSEPGGVGDLILDLVRGALQSDGTYRTLTEVVSREDGHDSSSYRVHVIALPPVQRFGECVVVIRDVSQQIRADRSREEFITHVTHELRTPLTSATTSSPKRRAGCRA